MTASLAFLTLALTTTPQVFVPLSLRQTVAERPVRTEYGPGVGRLDPGTVNLPLTLGDGRPCGRQGPIPLVIDPRNLKPLL